MNKYLPTIIGTSINFISYFSTEYASKLAIQLFSTPQKGKVKKDDIDFLNTSNQEVVHFESIMIKTYRWHGEKETVLLAHGWESNTSRWKKLIKILKDLNYNIVALDAPAHGNSGGKQFNAVLYSECIGVVAKKHNPSIIIGHSVGGMASILSAYNHKMPFLQKLILLGAPSNFDGIFNRYVDMMGYNKKVFHGINQLVLERFNNPTSYFSVENFSKKVNSKLLIVHDKEDQIIPYSDAMDYKKHYENSKLLSTSGKGHGLKSDDINEHIISFINQ